MKTESVELRGITWNHSRGFTPLAAAAQRFEELNPGVRISWDRRSLQAFADEPLDQLARRYDLLVIDHPWTGFAARHGVILPLNGMLPAEFLADQARFSVGASYESYCYGERLWALPIDAATPVASSRPDLLKNRDLAVPDTWEEMLELAKAGLVAIPGIPQDTLMNFYMLCSTVGEDPCQTQDQVVSHDVGVQALQSLRELASYLDARCFDWNPIQVYEAMTREDRFAYCPFAYGYSNYARDGYARTRLRFDDLVTFGQYERCRTTLGGTGLAISAQCKHTEAAARYAEFVGNPACQAGLYFDMGGQPGHRMAWLAQHTNEMTDDYFTDTLPALDRAFLRPRYHGHMSFQDHAGSPIREYLMHGGDERALLSKLNELYLTSLQMTA